VSGGYDNHANGYTATVSGGYQNIADGDNSVVSGGSGRTAAAYADWVGGQYTSDY